jgi:hypothetical protein
MPLLLLSHTLVHSTNTVILQVVTVSGKSPALNVSVRQCNSNLFSFNVHTLYCLAQCDVLLMVAAAAPLVLLSRHFLHTCSSSGSMLRNTAYYQRYYGQYADLLLYAAVYARIKALNAASG